MRSIATITQSLSLDRHQEPLVPDSKAPLHARFFHLVPCHPAAAVWPHLSSFPSLPSFMAILTFFICAIYLAEHYMQVDI